MGVPAFFSWLAAKYPAIVHKLRLAEAMFCDNLYLDMNNIIHPCSHPEDRPNPADEAALMAAIHAYIDFIVARTQPRKVIFLAVDGVAPRAKLNQQRSRRFRAAQEAAHKAQLRAEKTAELRAQDALPPARTEDGMPFDPNSITPGTPFMQRVSASLRGYLADRLAHHPAWAGRTVIFSDGNAPGEGEHKVMAFVREQRGSPLHNANTRHVMYGADADLVMLGLLTHEPHFYVLREEFRPPAAKPCEICGFRGHELKNCQGLAGNYPADLRGYAVPDEPSLLVIELPLLREHLKWELGWSLGQSQKMLERRIDDWVFLCFFVGNDFLPRLPSLKIEEGAIDRIIAIYKQKKPTFQGFITDKGTVNLDALAVVLQELAKLEEAIFSRRAEKVTKKAKEKIEELHNHTAKSLSMRQSAILAGLTDMPEARMLEACRNTTARFDSAADSSTDGGVAGDFGAFGGTVDSDRAVRLGDEGWRSRYYEHKFQVAATDAAFISTLVKSYLEGLCWVLLYYYHGCPSWDWCYKFHFAPFASDFELELDGSDGAAQHSKLRKSFVRTTTPLYPLEQLMAVFPPGGASYLPPALGGLMTDDASSPLSVFYPRRFNVDRNGERHAWQGVAIIAMVNLDLLRATVRPLLSSLSAEDAARNTHKGPEVLANVATFPSSALFQAGMATRSAGLSICGHIGQNLVGLCVLYAQPVTRHQADSGGLAHILHAEYVPLQTHEPHSYVERPGGAEGGYNPASAIDPAPALPPASVSDASVLSTPLRVVDTSSVGAPASLPDVVAAACSAPAIPAVVERIRPAPDKPSRVWRSGGSLPPSLLPKRLAPAAVPQPAAKRQRGLDTGKPRPPAGRQ